MTHSRAATLPEWDLSDLYPGPDSPELEADIMAARREAADFRTAYHGKLPTMDGATLGAALRRYEALSDRLGRIMSYAQLLFATDMTDAAKGRFYQTVQERVNDITAETLFFTLELNKLEDDALAAKLKDPAPAHYGPWLRDLRVYRPHQLSDEAERLLHDKSVTGSSAWVRLFDETLAGLRFPIGRRKLTLSDTLNMLSDKEPARRRDAAKALGKVLGENERLFTLVINTLAKDKAIEDGWRKHPRPVSRRNLNNLVEDEVVDALVTAVTESFPRLAHRYYKLKAQWFGVEALDYWDRNAPLPEDADRRFSWPEARKTVLNAYGAFAPDLAEIAKGFFDKGWIDAALRPGKESGAFAHPVVPSAHPYILMNFHGRSRDVMTLAHELGHGVHQVLAAGQGTLMADTPLTLAETASVFGEMLTFRSLLASETDPKRRRIMLAGKVEDMLNTVVRQIAFHLFETQVHDERRQGELSAERLGEIWFDVQSRSLGPGIRFHEEYRHFWAYIPHFIHSPFYVYAYAFGDCLVNALYDTFRQGLDGFQDKYLEMLKAGGTLRHKELLAPFGLDATDPAFWNRGLNVVSGLIDELERDANA